MNSCPFVNTTLIFSEETIAPCYIYLSENPPLYINKCIANRVIDFKQRKKEIIDILNSERIESFTCKNCCNLNTTQEQNTKYNHFIISLWDGNRFEYNFYEIIKQLYDQDLVDKENLKIEIHSKDFLILSSLGKMISIFSSYGFKEIVFMMNGIIYLPIIDKLLSENKASLYIILDYKDDGKIVEKEYGPQHVLRSYILAAKDKNAISVHYQLIREYNDTLKDIKKFITTMYRIGINKIGINLENKDINSWLQEPLPLTSCPKKLRELIISFFKLAKKYSFYINLDYREQNIVFKKIFKTHKKREIRLIKNIKKIFTKKDDE